MSDDEPTVQDELDQMRAKPRRAARGTAPEDMTIDEMLAEMHDERHPDLNEGGR